MVVEVLNKKGVMHLLLAFSVAMTDCSIIKLSRSPSDMDMKLTEHVTAVTQHNTTQHTVYNGNTNREFHK